MEATEKKRFLAMEVGKDVYGNPHAFHVEGYVSRDPYFQPATEEKKAYLGTAIGINIPDEQVMALATGTYEKGKNYSGSTFLSVNIFGRTAEDFAKVCSKGVKVAVSGKLEWREYTARDGSPVKELRVLASHIVVMGSRNVEPVISNNIGIATRVYKGKDGVERSQAYAELLSGTVIGAGGLRTSSSGKKYLSFGIKGLMPAKKVFDLVTGAKGDGSYEQKYIINAVLFDRQAEILASIIRNGAEVVCTGPVSSREYNGDVSYQMQPRVCSIMKFAPQDASQAAAATPAPSGSIAEAGAVDASQFYPILSSCTRMT